MEKSLTLLDLAFVAIESRVQTGHVGGLAIFKLPEGTEEDFFRRAIESHRDWQRANGLCALKLSRKGIGLGWVEDPQVEVEAPLIKNSQPQTVSKAAGMGKEEKAVAVRKPKNQPMAVEYEAVLTRGAS